MRIEPPPSVPSCKAPMPSVTAAAAPADDPPVVILVSQGLRVMPVSGLSLVAFQPNSGIAVLPSTTAPCSVSRATAGAANVRGAAEGNRDPKRDGMPITATLSVTASGTPSTRPSGVPAGPRPFALRARGSQGTVGVEVAVGVDHGIEALNAGQRRLHGLDRGQLLAAIEAQKLAGRHLRGVARSCRCHLLTARVRWLDSQGFWATGSG